MALIAATAITMAASPALAAFTATLTLIPSSLPAPGGEFHFAHESECVEPCRSNNDDQRQVTILYPDGTSGGPFQFPQGSRHVIYEGRGTFTGDPGHHPVTFVFEGTEGGEPFRVETTAYLTITDPDETGEADEEDELEVEDADDPDDGDDGEDEGPEEEEEEEGDSSRAGGSGGSADTREAEDDDEDEDDD